MNDFSKAKVGDKVQDFQQGWGYVESIDHSQRPIVVKFNNNVINTYYYNGTQWNTDINPSLFWDELKYEIPKKPFNLKEILKEMSSVAYTGEKLSYMIAYNLNTQKFEYVSLGSNFYISNKITSKYDVVNDVVDLLNERKISIEEFSHAEAEVIASIDNEFKK